jgi:PAS domain S-box-containing protein
MTPTDNRADQTAALRRLAEGRALAEREPSCRESEALLPAQSRETLHELRVHQIQLEMQNEELRRIQEELAIARARYFDLYDLAPVGYCTLSANGLILEANLTASALLGMPRGALINQPFSRFVLKEDQDIYYLHRQQNLEPGAPHVCELRMVKADDTSFWVHLATSLTPQAHGASECRLVMSDIAERKLTEEALHEREAQYRQVMETAREGIGFTDTNWRVVFVNNHMAGLLGYDPEEMVGRPAEDFLFAEDKVDYTRRMEDRQQGRSGNYECRFRRKDGSEIWTLVSATPQMDKAGAFTGSLTMLTDITDRRVAEASSKAKSDFLALVSHEIRTPLNALVGFSSLARKTRDPDILQQYLDIIDQSSQSLMDLVNDILEMSKIEAGLLHLESIPFNLVNTIDLIAWQYAPLAKQKKLDFHISKGRDLPRWISGDPLRLRQILANLITNAIKFTESGSVTLTLTTTTPAEGDGRILVRLTVQDTGIGIPADKLNILFQPFRQIDPSITRQYGGTGLGLAIVESLAKLMHGRVEVTSEEGRGCCFVVELPFPVSDPPDYTKMVTPVVTPFDILVVEDNAFNRRFLVDILTSWGHTVTAAENALHALGLTERSHYDLIIVDVRMPGMDGIELAGRIRGWERERDYQPMPIIACTADTGGDTKEQCLAAGMQDVLIKPIDPDKLAQAIAEYCYPSVVANIPPRVEPIPINMLTDRIVMDMGYDSEQMQVYLQLLGDDIHAELNRLHRAVGEGDRSLLRAAAHSLKGLCGHLQNPLPMELAQHLHEGAMILSYPELRDTVQQLSAVCERLGSNK